MLDTLTDALVAEALGPVLTVILTAFFGVLTTAAYRVAGLAKDKLGLDVTAQIQMIEAQHKQNLIDAARREIIEIVQGDPNPDPRTIADRVQGYWERTSKEAVEVLQPSREFAERVVSEGLQDIKSDLLQRVNARLEKYK